MSDSKPSLGLDNVKVNIKADLTPVVKEVGGILKSLPASVKTIIYMFWPEQMRDAILQQAQDAYDARQIADGTSKLINGDLICTTTEQLESSPVAYPLLSKAREDENKNLTKCVVAAIEHTSEQSDVTAIEHDAEQSKAPDSDQNLYTFFMRWRSEAKYVSEPEMQDLWGRILAGELASPNSFSLKTMDIIRNISSREANIFANMADNVLFGSFVFGSPHDGPGISLLSDSDSKLMGEIGLLQFLPEIFQELPYPAINRGNKRGFFFDYGDYGIFLYTAGKQDFFGHFLTSSGRELYKFTDKPDEEKAKKIAILLLTRYQLDRWECGGAELVKYIKRSDIPEESEFEHICNFDYPLDLD